MKTRFTAIVIFTCVLYAGIPAIASPENKEQDLEEGCSRSCLSDYSKIAKCDVNKMIVAYITELNSEN